MSIAYTTDIVKHEDEKVPTETDASSKFPGFKESNGHGYTQFNNGWFDEMLSQITNLAELKVVQYIHRHTVGYHRREVCLSVEEIALGRERSDGERYDRGTGLCPRSVKSGIQRAVKHGYITRRQQGNTVYFSLNIIAKPEQKASDQEGQDLHPSTDATEGQNLHRTSARPAPAAGKTCTQGGKNLHPSTRSDPHSGRSTGRSRSSNPPPKETPKKFSKEREKERDLSLSPNSEISTGQSTAGGYQEGHYPQTVETRHNPQSGRGPENAGDAINVSHEERVRMNLEKYAALLAKTRKNEAA